MAVCPGGSTGFLLSSMATQRETILKPAEKLNMATRVSNQDRPFLQLAQMPKEVTIRQALEWTC